MEPLFPRIRENWYNERHATATHYNFSNKLCLSVTNVETLSIRSQKIEPPKKDCSYDTLWEFYRENFGYGMAVIDDKLLIPLEAITLVYNRPKFLNKFSDTIVKTIQENPQITNVFIEEYFGPVSRASIEKAIQDSQQITRTFLINESRSNSKKFELIAPNAEVASTEYPISSNTIIRALLVAGLAGTHLLRKTKLGWVFAIGTAALGIANIFSSKTYYSRKGNVGTGMLGKPSTSFEVVSSFSSHTYSYKGNVGTGMLGKPSTSFETDGRSGETSFSTKIPLPLPASINALFHKYGSKISLATTFVTVSLTQLMAVHYAIKPLAGRHVPVLSGFLRGVTHHVGKYPIAVPIATLLAISALFTYLSAPKKRPNYETI